MTAAAIAGVLIAGTAAVAANIGILNSADSSAIGDLAATDELLPTTGVNSDTAAVIVETTLAPTTTATTTPPATGVQRYDIENTGTVWVMTTTSGLALDHVVAEPAWTPVLSQGDPRSLRVDFVNGDRTIVFTAAIADDGAVVVDVTEPSTVVAGSATSSGTQFTADATPAPTIATYSDDDSYDDDSYDDDSDDHADEVDDDHDGADDDD